eukprot:c21415_g2_i2.p1 GENE.c21415_g2_i2~~c21415_g2_i2.p1  ORF type:complete len:180 (+),score=56.64 c21415_g2_i2:3-542(+)
MEDENIEVLERSIKPFENAIGELEDKLNELLDQQLDDVYQNEDPLKVAQLEISLAYALNSCFFMFLKTQGIPVKEHPVKRELERVKTQMTKLKEAQTGKNQPSARVDPKAAERVINHSIGSKRDTTVPTNEQQQEETNSNSSSKKRKAELSSSHRSTPRPKSAHLEFRQYQQLRGDSQK